MLRKYREGAQTRYRLVHLYEMFKCKKKNLKLYKTSKPKEIIIVIFRERINQISYLISFHSLE